MDGCRLTVRVVLIMAKHVMIPDYVVVFAMMITAFHIIVLIVALLRHISQRRVINKKMILLMRNLGISDSEIKRVQLQAIRDKELADGPMLFASEKTNIVVPKFKDCELPDGSELLDDVLQSDAPDKRAILGAKYLIDRGLYDHVSNIYWSPTSSI